MTVLPRVAIILFMTIMGEFCLHLHFLSSIYLTFAGSFTFLVLLAAIYSVSTENAPSLEGVLTTQDKQRLLQLFQSARLDNLETIFYVSKGLEMLGDTGKVTTAVALRVKK